MRVFIIVIIQIAFVGSNLQIKDAADKIKSILTRYKNFRDRRCVKPNLKLDSFVDSTVNFLVKTERFGDFLKSYNASECAGDITNSAHYLERHIDGLLIHENVSDRHWDEYKSVFDKSYISQHHEMAAWATWLDNLKLIARHNRDYLSGKHSYSLHLNHFADWDVSDYVTDILKLISTIPLFDPARDYSRSAYRRIKHRSVPRTVDWRSRGFTPRREEQWHCGACYAFAVTHALQAQLYRKHRQWRELSPQQIVDCSFKDGNMGCDGGSLQAALRYASRAGLAMEAQYPYLGKRGVCHYSHSLVRVRPRRWATLPSGDEAALERALATIGPLAVAVNAAPITFQFYRNGIYDDPFCVPWKMNHAMLLVGYTPQYWILLNWWGRHWGEDGYMRIRRGLNTCGVANMAVYVEL
ncbi:unnamed protein product [Parnassius mnemosyne]|uniref:Uncharacterized protein n=1 Tax=Parnassius mnemosyne TaxID=213953 RepID=A0AAV1LJG1_9NEOP